MARFRHMNRGKAIFLGIILGLAACGREPATEGPANSIEEAEARSALLPDADINASLGELVVEPAPDEADRPFRFVGRWAAEESRCATTAWRFTESELSTPAGSSCRFSRVREVPGGYDIHARCTAEGPERDDVLELRFAESARAMLFESETIADAGLVSCGP